MRAKFSLDAERARPPFGGRPGKRALAAPAFTSAAFALAARSASLAPCHRNPPPRRHLVRCTDCQD